MALVIDTAPLRAALDVNDRDHARGRDSLADATETVIGPGPVVVELERTPAARVGRDQLDDFLDDVEIGGVGIERLDAQDHARIGVLLRQHGDAPLGFVDAPVVVVCERLGEGKVATLDHRDCSVIGPSHTRSLRLLPDA